MRDRTLYGLEGGICCFPSYVDRTDVFLVVPAFHKGMLCAYDDKCIVDHTGFDDSGTQLIALHILEIFYWSTSIWLLGSARDGLDEV